MFSLVGCSNVFSPDKSKENATHILTDAVGKKVTLPLKPKRIVSLNLGTDELIMDLVSPDRITALSYIADDPGISHIAERSKSVKNKIKDYNAESILAMKPDLIIIADWWNLNTLQTLRDLGLNVYVYKTPYNLEDIKKTIREVAFVVGEKEKGEAIVAEYEKILLAAKNRVESFAKKNKRSVLAITNHGAFGGKGSLYDDMCAYIEVENCMKDIPQKGNQTISKEVIVEKNPDVIISVAWDHPGMAKSKTTQEIINDPALKTIKAVKNKNVRLISAKSLYCVSHYSAIGVDLLARAVYPEAYD